MSLRQNAREGDLVAVKKLLQAGLPVDAVPENTDEDLPALAEAAARGDLAMVQTLLASHADPSAVDGAAVRIAARHGHTAILQLLLKQGASEHDISEALIAAAFQMKLDVVRMLAARLANPKVALSEALYRTSNGSTGWEAEELTVLGRTLLQLGADPNMAEADGLTPLMLAAASGKPEQVRLLLEAGASANPRCACPYYNNGGWTALGLAADSPDTDKVTRLIAAGADVNARNAEGETPLPLATSRPNVEAVKALLKAGADVNARSRSGDSAMRIAARGHAWPDKIVYYPELVALLASYGGKR